MREEENGHAPVRTVHLNVLKILMQKAVLISANHLNAAAAAATAAKPV
jgi:hypothetical protein